MRLRAMGTAGVATMEPPSRYPYAFEADVVTSERGDLLQISTRDEALWRRGPSAKLPKVGRIKATPADDQTLTVSWTGDDPATPARSGSSGRTTRRDLARPGDRRARP